MPTPSPSTPTPSPAAPPTPTAAKANSFVPTPSKPLDVPPTADQRDIGGVRYEKSRRRCPVTGETLDVIAECRPRFSVPEGTRYREPGPPWTGPSLSEPARFDAFTTLLALVTHPAPSGAGLFGVGELRLSPDLFNKVRIDRAAIDNLIARHRAGDFGDLGRLDAVTLDDDRRWVPDLFGPATRSAVAIESGRGFVLSRYHVPQEGEAAPTSSQPERRADAVVEILTWLRGDAEATTVVWSPSVTSVRFD